VNEQEQVKLAAYIAETFHDDPAGYSEHVIGVKLDPWQIVTMESVRDNRRTSVRACHGPGKTFVAAVIIKWWMATRGYPRVRSTANTEKQIMSILWSELAKVHRMSKDRELYEWTKTGYFLKSAPEVHWAQALAWSENNSEAFAGLHAPNTLYVFDESSAVVDIIWEVATGAMTHPDSRWLVMGNPTRNTGKFHECFGKNKWQEGDTDSSLWHCQTISAFDSPRVSPEYISEIEREYGKDSDPYRVRVLGLPPMQESQQFIPVDLFETALHKNVISLPHEPRILMVDPARFGDDRTAIGERKGRNANVLKIRRGQDTMLTVGDVIDCMNTARREGESYDYVLVDEIGIGAGIVDRLREQNIDVIGVNVSERPRRDDCKNLTAELWLLMKEWLKEGHISEEFRDDLIGRQYSFDSSGRLVMERKEDMKKRGLSSPDLADMLALSFYPMNPIKKTQRIQTKPRASIIRRSGVR
jgi:hypothetical protein